MAWLIRLNRPWLHFLILGIVFLQMHAFLFPAPKPVIGPLSDARIEALEQLWADSTGEPLSPAQKSKLIVDELDRELLFQRALEFDLHLHDKVVYQQLIRNLQFLGLATGKSDAELFSTAIEMRLYLSDEVTKRRLVQVMEQILVAENPPPLITETQIEAARLAREDELRRPKWYSIAHLYFTPDRESEIESVMARVAQESLDAEGARQLSSPFLLGYEFWQQTPHQLAGLFGASFPEQLEKIDLTIGRWHGPIASSYGYHYIWLHEFQAARPARFEEVERQLRQELSAKARSLALQRGKESLRAEYEVRI